MQTRIEQDLELNLEREWREALGAIGASRTLARIEQTILRRTQRGEFLPGSSPGASQYSTKGFARPAGGLSATAIANLEGDPDSRSFFTKSGGALWLFIPGGYKQLRETEGYQTDHVDLYKRGDLLGAMRGESRWKGGVLTMAYGYLRGKSEAQAIQIADYHNRLGAGKGKTLRKYVGLTEQEEQPIVGGIEDDVFGSLGV